MTNTSTLNRVERACAELHHDGHAVTFTAVAARTGLGRTTLYRDPTLRAVIEEHRHRTATSGTFTCGARLLDSGADLPVRDGHFDHATISYSLVNPPRTGRRRTRWR